MTESLKFKTLNSKIKLKEKPARYDPEESRQHESPASVATPAVQRMHATAPNLSTSFLLLLQLIINPQLNINHFFFTPKKEK